jgi:hypothetical protein
MYVSNVVTSGVLPALPYDADTGPSATTTDAGAGDLLPDTGITGVWLWRHHLRAFGGRSV